MAGAERRVPPAVKGAGVQRCKVGSPIMGDTEMESRCQGKAHWSSWERRSDSPHLCQWGEIIAWPTAHLAPVMEPNLDEVLLQLELPSDAADLLGCGLLALQEEFLQAVSDVSLPVCPSVLPSLLQDRLHFA